MWFHTPEDESAPREMRVMYWLNDQCNQNASDVNMVVVNPALAECPPPTPGEGTINTMYGGDDADQDGEPDGIKVYELGADDLGGVWRCLWTASDACGPFSAHRRTHDEQRMLVANEEKCILVPSENWKGPDWAWLRDELIAHQQTEHKYRYQPGKSRFSAAAYEFLPTAATLKTALKEDAILMLESHGGPGYQYIAKEGDPDHVGQVVHRKGASHVAGRDLALSDLAGLGGPKPPRFVNFVGCETALSDPSRPSLGNLLDGAKDAGAAAAGGFKEGIRIWAAAYWVDKFYESACVDGKSIFDASKDAQAHVKDKYGQFCGFDEYFISPWHHRDTTLVPAGFGVCP